MKRRKIRKALVLTIVTSLLLGIILPSVISKAEAAGVQVYADLTNDTGNPQTPSTVTTTAYFADNTATTVYFSYTASSAFVNGDNVKLTFPTGFTITNGSTTDADNDGTPDGSGAVNGIQYTYTFSASSGANVEFAVSVTAPTGAAGNYSVGMGSSNDNDFGATLLYVYEDSGPTYQNRVNVSAQVVPNLTLSITNTSDTETDTCNLGNLDIVSVKTCQYRVYPGTNQVSGTATLQIADISSNAGLTKGGGGDVDNIDNTAVNTNVVAGTEGYGFSGAATGSTFTLQGNYASAGADPVPATTTSLATTNGYVDGAVGSGNYLTFTHSASIDAGTQSGVYSQTIQYTLVSAP